ncbi:MAG: GHKL domain-containing protein [Clostridia bacterium]|nr:GHKL domain-containing protein [Clostridia bacterium]
MLETLNKDKENYGYGIKSIKAITKKYKGEFVWE